MRGLINSKSNADKICFQWCTRCHQTATCMNDSRLCKLKNVDDRYNYKGMEFPTSYDAISTFEETNRVCIFKKEFDSEGKIILRQQGRLEHLTTKFKS